MPDVPSRDQRRRHRCRYGRAGRGDHAQCHEAAATERQPPAPGLAVEGIGEGLPHFLILERFPIHIEHEIVRAGIEDGDELPAQDRVGFERGNGRLAREDGVDRAVPIRLRRRTHLEESSSSSSLVRPPQYCSLRA